MSLFPSFTSDKSKRPPDETLDTLAAVLRTFGKMAFDLTERNAPAGAKSSAATKGAAVAEEAERWARRLLIGVGREADAPSAREFVEVRQWFEARRTAEKSFVDEHMVGVRSAVTDFLRGVRGLLTEDKQSDVAIDGHLDLLEKALAEGRVDRLPELIPRAVEGIRGVMAKRQATFRDQLSAMGERVATLRQDLDTTKREAELDPLTRVHNRAAFDRALEQAVALACGTSEPFVLVFVDLDHFKKLNDTHGHPAGDAFLKKTADTLVRCFPRKDDLVARYGGEEFCVIVRDVDVAARDRLIARLLTAIREQRCPAPYDKIAVTGSVGTAMWKKGDTGKALLERADAAMYAAKRSGRDRAVHG